MGLKIDNGVLLSPDANGNYVERAAFNNDGDLVFKNADGSSKGAGITESAGDLRYLQLLGGTVTGAFHANHTSNTFSGASVTAANLHINDTNTKLTEGAGNAVRIQTGTGYVDIGSMNSSWVHFQADRSVYMWANGGAFSFDADVVPYANNAKNLGNSSSRWATIYANGGDSSQWNTAYGWGNHSGLYLGISAKAADSNLLDGIDSTSFFRKDVEAQDISGYVRINKNWGGGTYGAEAFTIRGTHPSFSLRSTQADYKWLFHTDESGNLRIYTGSVADDNAWTNRFSFTTANNFHIESGHLYVQSGNVYASGGNSTLWNTAYSWGNHASAGYLTSLPAHTHDDRYYTESEVDTLLATKSATSHTHNVYDLNNYNSNQDPNTYLQSRIWTSLNGSTVGNYPSSYSGVVNLGMTSQYGLQFSYHYGGTDDGLYFRHKSDNPGAPNGVGWQGWKTVASRQWVQAQGYLTSSGIGSYATQQYVTDSINSLINGAPGALNTLDELAAALGDDANFASTVTNSISTKVSKSGDTMTGNLTIAQSSGNNTLTINSNGGGTPVIYMYSPSRWWGQFVSNNNLTFKDETGNIEVLTLEAGGNVGVGLADPAYKLDVSGDINASAAVKAYQFQGNANVGGTGNASYHPSGIYSTGTNWLYGTMYLNTNAIYEAGDIRTAHSSYHFRARYNSGNDNYHASLNWYGLQLGNNGDNYIVGGRTNPGGNLRFYVNNTSDFTTINGTLSAIMHSTGRTTFGGGTDYGYTLNVAGSFYATDWIRVGGTQGLYFESYGGGWNMTDTTWIRAYNDKNIYTGGYMRAARFEDANDSAYYLDPNGTSNLNAVQTTSISATSSSTATGVSFRQPYEVISGESWALASYAYNDNDGFLWLNRDNAGGQARPVFHIGGKNNASHGGYAAEDSIITLTRTDGVKTDGTSYAYRGLSSSAYYTSIIKTTTGTVFRDAQSRYDFVGSVYAKGATSGADVLAIDGINGRLFTVTDDLSDSLFSVNTVAGLPVMEVFADNSIVLGKFGVSDPGTTYANGTIKVKAKENDYGISIIGDYMAGMSFYANKDDGYYASQNARLGWVGIYQGNLWFQSAAPAQYSAPQHYFDGPVYASIIYDSDNNGYYVNPNSTSRLDTVNANELRSYGNTYLGDGSGDETHINDIVRIGATDSGDAHLFFGEGGAAGSDYGAHWYWDSGYTFTWNTRNAGSDTALFTYVTNDTTYVNWFRHFNMGGKELNYVGQVHFNSDGPILQRNNSRNLVVKGGSSSDVGIVGLDSAGNNRFQIYGAGSEYGFLDGTWAAWDLRKVKGGNLYMNNDGTYYLNTSSTSYLYNLNVNQTITTTSHGTSANWNTAYGWGNHASAGYLVKGSTQAEGAWTDATKFKSAGDIGVDTSSQHSLQVYADINNDAFMAFHISGDYAVFFGLENATNRLYTGGWSAGGNKYQIWDSRDFSSGNISNWNTAYGWGNHASAGYAASGHNHDGSYLPIGGKAADSNLLDGLDLHTGRNNEVNKVVRTDANGYIQAGWINSTSGAFSSGINKIYCSDDDYIRYQTPANFISNLGLITTGNIGSQSVNYATSAGNADTVDGYHATNAAGGLAVINANGYWYPPSWINVGGTGIYSGTNNAHFLPNSTSPHGSWEIIGSKGGWSGIYFRDSGNTLMANANDSGFYNANAGWQIEWYNGTLSVSKQANGGGTLATVVDSVNYTSLIKSVVTIQDTVPGGTDGQLWWESDTGKLKVRYNSAWVDASPNPDMSIYYTKAGGAITGEVTIQQTLTVVGNVLIEGTLTETSDITLKENILPLQDSLNKVLKLNGVSFNKKTTPELKEIGFIAQEVEEVLPELVTETDEGIKTVAYSRVTAVLVETIKEQQAQIDELKQIVNKLVEKLNTL